MYVQRRACGVMPAGSAALARRDAELVRSDDGALDDLVAHRVAVAVTARRRREHRGIHDDIVQRRAVAAQLIDHPR